MVKTEKQTNYQILLDLKKQNLFTPLISSGIIGLHLASWIDIYTDFLNEISKPRSRKSDSITFVIENYNNKISERQVYNIIKFMEA